MKVVDGGWVPLGIAAAVFTVMTTWRHGRQRVVTRLVEAEGTLDDLLADLARRDVLRVPGTAIFPHPSDETVPLALRANVERNNILHEHVIIVSAGASRLAHVGPEDQLRATDIGPTADGLVHLDLRYGFFDRPDIPTALAHAANQRAGTRRRRPRQRHLLPLPRHPGRRTQPRHGDVAQAPLLATRPQCRQPGPHFRPPRQAHHRHGNRDRI